VVEAAQSRDYHESELVEATSYQTKRIIYIYSRWQAERDDVGLIDTP
jgi:hypothetical protein